MAWGTPSIGVESAAGQPAYNAQSSSDAPPSSTIAAGNAPAEAQYNNQINTLTNRLGYFAPSSGGGGGTSAADQAAMQDLLNRGFDIQGRQIDSQGKQLGLQGQQLDLKALGIGLQDQGQDINAQRSGLQAQGLGVDQQYLQSLLPDYLKQSGLAQELSGSQDRQAQNTYGSQRRQMLDAAAAGGSFTSSGTRAGLGELGSTLSESTLQNNIGLQDKLIGIGQQTRRTQGDLIKNKLSQQGISLDLSQIGLNKKDLANQLKGIDLDKMANALSIQDLQALRDQLQVDREKATLQNKSGGGRGGGGLSVSDLQGMWAIQDKISSLIYDRDSLYPQAAQGSQVVPGSQNAPDDADYRRLLYG